MFQVCDRYFLQCLVSLKELWELYGGLELRIHASKANIVICFAFSLSYVITALNAMPLYFEASHS